MTLKEVFIKARKSQNLTQQQFASLLGLTTNTIGAIETGKTTRIKSATLTALASFLKVSELALVQVINGELECSWDELLAQKWGPVAFCPDSDYRIRRFIENSNNTYDLIIKRAKDTDFYLTTDKRDHRHLILLLPFETLNYQDSFTERSIESEIDLYGRLMIVLTMVRELTPFRSVWILFDDCNPAELAFYNTFSTTTKIAYITKVDYVLYDYPDGKIIEQTKMTV